MPFYSQVILLFCIITLIFYPLLSFILHCTFFIFPICDNNINILGQHLQTTEKVGYVVLDVDAEYSDLALKALKGIEGTMRCRVLF